MCLWDIYMCVCLLISYVVKQWPTYVGQAKIKNHVVTKFSLDDAKNDIQINILWLWSLDMKFVQQELEL